MNSQQKIPYRIRFELAADALPLVQIQEVSEVVGACTPESTGFRLEGGGEDVEGAGEVEEWEEEGERELPPTEVPDQLWHRVCWVTHRMGACDKTR